jgi:hypothetical protein
MRTPDISGSSPAAEPTSAPRGFTFPRAFVLRALSAGLTIGILAATPLMWWVTAQALQPLGGDFHGYQTAVERFLATGSPYAEWQLSGPYGFADAAREPFLHPPTMLLLAVPFHFVPAILWYAIPIAVVVGTVAWWRPAWWSWPVLAALLFWPRTATAVVTGNSDLWVSAGVALWPFLGWTAAVAYLKPSVLPVAILGLRRRSFWIATAATVVFGVVTLPLWFEWITALRNFDQLPLTYSLLSLPVISLPLIAWLGRTRRTAASPRPA